MVPQYENQVYAGVLGKIIGVYLGRPFEGWSKAAIQERWGSIDRYVHEDRDVPLIVSDDDITGTFTFIKALDDSLAGADTDDAFYGKSWLNYIIENKTILWWGGMGHSAEHTAYLRLKNGIESPRSGSTELNGKIVSEQIGAQIFIDAFGMVFPNQPERAAAIAAKSARVSHDGEAVYGAQVIAAMVSAAFVEKDMDTLLDIGVSVIPQSSKIARLHRDVRAWAKTDKDWEKTFKRIEKKWGYDTYGGNCHMIPNHALIVLALVYAPNDFHESQRIVNTAGWDTDCNAANVGSIMGIKLGLDAIDERYDFRGPVADRMFMPTSEPTDTMTDACEQTLYLTRLARRLNKKPAKPAIDSPKDGAWHHFNLPGAVQGFVSDESSFESRGNMRVSNVAGHSTKGKRALAVGFSAGPGRRSRVLKKLVGTCKGGYQVMAVSRLYPGMTWRAQGSCGKLTGKASLVPYIEFMDGTRHKFSPKGLREGKAFRLSMTIPDHDCGVAEIGYDVQSGTASEGIFYVDAHYLTGAPSYKMPRPLHGDLKQPNWIHNLDNARGPFSDDISPLYYLIKNQGFGYAITGTKDWTDYTLESDIKIHLGGRGGLIARWQGQERFLAVVVEGKTLSLVERYYEERVLDSVTVSDWKPYAIRRLRLRVKGHAIEAALDGKVCLSGTSKSLTCGGGGFFVDSALVGFKDVAIQG